MLDTVPWFGFVPHYQSQLAGGTQLHVVQIRPGLFALCSSTVRHWGELWCHSTLLCFDGFLCILNTHTLTHTHRALEHTHTHTHTQVNTHYAVVVWSDKGLVTGGQGVTEGVWPSAEATALNLPLSFLCNKCDRLISAQKEQLQGVV